MDYSTQCGQRHICELQRYAPQLLRLKVPRDRRDVHGKLEVLTEPLFHVDSVREVEQDRPRRGARLMYFQAAAWVRARAGEKLVADGR